MILLTTNHTNHTEHTEHTNHTEHTEHTEHTDGTDGTKCARCKQVAKGMKVVGGGMEIISKSTGLSKEEIEKL